MTTTTDDRSRRSRRTIVLAGGLALVALFVVGALVTVPRIERDLSDDVEQELAAVDMIAVADFSGQDATLRCVQPLADPSAAADIAAGVDGVHDVTIDASCIGTVVPSDSSTTVPVTTVAPTTAPATTPPTTTTSPPASTTPSTTTTVPVVGVVTVAVADGRITLAGTVANEQQHATLLIAAADSVDPSNVTDGITVDPAVAATDEEITQLASLVGAMVGPLVTGESGWATSGLYARGTFTDDAARSQFEAATASVGVTPTLSPRPVATAEDAAALEAELNQLVAAEPILFDKGATTIAAVSAGTLQRVAGLAKRYAGLTIQVQGHTDSEGDAGRNQTLSEQRAESVRAALALLGVPGADLTSVGFGESQLITDATGKEIPEQSRRVVFGVTPNS